MTTIKNVTMTKIASAVVAVAMMTGLMFAVAAERAQAVTLSELVELFIALDIIPADKADEARSVLTNQDDDTTGGSMSCSTTFTRDLSMGATGTDVMALQVFLNTSADTQVAASGAGSPGNETSYYGSLTAQAVSKFQVKYATDILAPLGLTSGTGYFGASSRAKANAVCTGAPGVPGVPGTPGTPGDDDDDDDDNLEGGEASLEEFDLLNSPSSVDLQEGDEETQVAGWEFEVNDADVSLNRVDVRFQASAGDTGFSNDPWDTFESVQLFLGDEMIAEMDADDEDNWSDETGDAFEMRFSGLSEVLREDDTAELYVGVTVQSNVDEDDDGTTWNVWIPDDGVRARDAAGIDQYVGDADALADADHERTFDMEAAGEGEELTISLSSSNPDASTIQVDEDNQTDDVAILVFDMEAEDNDIEVSEIEIDFTMGSSTFDGIVDDVVLEIDGEVYDDFTTQNGDLTSASTTFDIDPEFVVEDGEEVEVRVLVTFKSQDGNYAASGETIQATVDVSEITAEGEDDVTAGGSAVGDEHALNVSGVFAEISSTSETETVVDAADNTGTFVVKFDVTAFEEDAYIDNVATRGSAASSSASGALYTLEDDDGDTLGSAVGTTSAVFTSTGDVESGEFVVREGETETFTLTVTYNPATQDAFYRVQVTEINFAETAGGTVSAYIPSPVEDFETDFLNIQS